LIDFAIAGALVFVMCLHSIPALLTFPLIAFKGFSIVINLYWIWARLGFVSGLFVFIAYAIFLVVLLFIFIMLAIYLMKQCALIRSYNIRRGIKWFEFWKIVGIHFAIVLVIAFIEWLVYAAVFSKMIFLVPMP
jgi:hypothetical protein